MSITGPRIEIIVDSKGVSRNEAIGIGGDGCQLATAPYEALQGDVLDTVATAEAYESPEEIEIKSQEGGCGG